MAKKQDEDLKKLLADIHRCRVCADEMVPEPRPVLRARATARLLIVGQAPGTRVFETGVPWNDPSGDRLREWLRLSRQEFYDDTQIAIVPMGFCYPGRDANGADLPPRPECAPLWHEAVMAHLTQVELVLLVGSHAQRYYFKKMGCSTRRSMTETVFDGPQTFESAHGGAVTFWPLPHPSWRNSAWLKKNPGFEAEILPRLRTCLARVWAG